MKKKSLLTLIGIFGFSSLFQSCTNDTDDYSAFILPTGLVTVCPNADGSFVMNLDDATVLNPTNLKSSPFGNKEVRALVNYTEIQGSDSKSVMKNVHVNWIDSIRTKDPVMSVADNDAVYGKDPIEIVQDWVTVAEDGYVTMRIRTNWGDSNIPHVINLLTGDNPEDAFEMELRHNANGDTEGRVGDALIAFNLNKIPHADEIVKIKLRWQSFSGEKSAEFDLKMRDMPPVSSEDAISLCGKEIY